MSMQRIRIIHWAALALLIIVPSALGDEYEWKDGQWVRQAPPSLGTAPGELAMIRQLVRQKQCSQAVNLAEKFLKKYPGDPAGEEVMFLAGQAEILREHYFQAYDWFERKLISEYPNGIFFERALDRMYEAGEAFLQGKKRIVWGFIYLPAQDDGLEILSRIADHAPGSILAEKALMRIADYHYSQQAYLEAVKAYDRYLLMFDKAPRASYAMLQSARASYDAFRGLEFDETPLRDAQTRFKNFKERFPDQAAKQNVPRSLEQITSLLAQKMLNTAGFYERVHHEEAARYYYQVIAQQYPKTMWEAQATAALARLPIPPERPGIMVPAAGEGETAGPVGTEPDSRPAAPAPPSKLTGSKRKDKTK